jgi:hypothetical protein
MVLNAAYDGPKLLPFDLRQRNAVIYTMPEEADERASVRRELSKKLENALRTIFLGRDTILLADNPLKLEDLAELGLGDERGALRSWFAKAENVPVKILDVEVPGRPRPHFQRFSN